MFRPKSDMNTCIRQKKTTIANHVIKAQQGTPYTNHTTHSTSSTHSEYKSDPGPCLIIIGPQANFFFGPLNYKIDENARICISKSLNPGMNVNYWPLLPV